MTHSTQSRSAHAGAFVRRHFVLILACVTLVPAAAWHVAQLIAIMASRIDLPMDIEWMEGGALYHAYRMLHGETVYGDPRLGFVPFAYPPLHAALLALLGRIVSLDFSSGRALSIFFFAGMLAVCTWEVLSHAPRRGTALLGVVALLGYVGASVPLVLSWYDLVRNDCPALAFPMLAAACVSGRLSLGRIVACAVLLSLAFYTKQTAIFFMGFVGAAVFLRSQRLGLLLGCVTGLLCAATLVGLQWMSDGWYLRWISVLNTHPVSAWRLWVGLRMVLEFAPFLPGVAVLAGWLRWRGRLSTRSLVWLAIFAAALPASLIPFAKLGGFNNNLIPLVVVGGLTSTLVVLDGFDALAAHARRTAAPRLERAVAAGLVLGGAMFFFVNRYDARAFMPSPALRAKVAELNELVASLEGSVVMPSHPFIPVRNGKTNEQMHVMAWWDASNSPLGPQLDLEGFFARSRPDWLLAAPVELAFPPLAAQIDRRFRFERRLPAPAQTLVGAAPTGPELLFRKRPRSG